MGVPPERVKDNGVITVNSIGVARWQTHITQLHLVAGNPMMHHSKAWVEGGPP